MAGLMLSQQAVFCCAGCCVAAACALHVGSSRLCHVGAGILTSCDVLCCAVCCAPAALPTAAPGCTTRRPAPGRATSSALKPPSRNQQQQRALTHSSGLRQMLCMGHQTAALLCRRQEWAGTRRRARSQSSEGGTGVTSRCLRVCGAASGCACVLLLRHTDTSETHGDQVGVVCVQ